MSINHRLAALAVAAATVATGAHAAELGEANVRSYIGQPLSAEIELTDLTTQDLAGLQVRLASPDIFEGANVKMAPALAGMNITVVPRDQRRVLRLTTSAPLQGEVVHLYFALTSGGKERVRGITLWLSPDPTPAPVRPPVPATAPVAAASAPVPAPVVKPAPRAAAVQLVASASPGKESTQSEKELLKAVERAFAGKNVKEVKPAKVRPEPVVAKAEPVPVAKPAKPEPEAEKPAPVRKSVLGLPDKSALAAATAEQRAVLKAEKAAPAPAIAKVEKPVAAPPPAKVEKAAPEPDAAMMKKLADLEGKLKALQAKVALDEAKVAAPAPAAVAQPAAKPVAAAEVKPAPDPAAKPVEAAVEEHAVEAPKATEASAAPAPEARKPEPEAKKPEPVPEVKPEEKKEIKMSRPKMLTILFGASLVLLVIFGIMVHFIRRAKMRKSTIVRQSWRRESSEDDEPRTEPSVAEESASDEAKAA